MELDYLYRGEVSYMNHIIVAYATLDDYEYMAISMISVLR